MKIKIKIHSFDGENSTFYDCEANWNAEFSMVCAVGFVSNFFERIDCRGWECAGVEIDDFFVDRYFSIRVTAPFKQPLSETKEDIISALAETQEDIDSVEFYRTVKTEHKETV